MNSYHFLLFQFLQPNYSRWQQIIKNLMETLYLKKLSLSIQNRVTDCSELWLYGVIKGDSTHCTKCANASSQDGVDLITPMQQYQILVPKTSNLFKLQIWDYEKVQKIAEETIRSTDMPRSKKKIELDLQDINGRRIILAIEYERKDTMGDSLSSRREPMLKLNYNKSQTNMRPQTPKYPYSPVGTIRPTMNGKTTEETKPTRAPHYDTYGKWKFIQNKMTGYGSSNGNPEQKLRL